MKLPFLIVCVFLLSHLTSVGALSQAPPSQAPPAAAVNATTADADDFSPGMFFAILIGVAAILVLTGIGIAIGGIAAGITALFIGVGIVSSSVVVGYLRRRPSAAIRALLFQGAALTGIPCGIAAFWIGRELAHVHLSIAGWVVWGALSGALSGLLVAFVLNFAWGRLYLQLTDKVRGR